jgi:hypothetical protein
MKVLKETVFYLTCRFNYNKIKNKNTATSEQF